MSIATYIVIGMAVALASVIIDPLEDDITFRTLPLAIIAAIFMIASWPAVILIMVWTGITSFLKDKINLDRVLIKGKKRKNDE